MIHRHISSDLIDHIRDKMAFVRMVHYSRTKEAVELMANEGYYLSATYDTPRRMDGEPSIRHHEECVIMVFYPLKVEQDA